MTFKEIKRSEKKIRLAFKRGGHKARRMHVIIDVKRSSRWRGSSITATRDDYEASACIAPWGTGSKLSSKGFQATLRRKTGEIRCGGAHGTTPTRAVKKALSDLSRRLR